MKNTITRFATAGLLSVSVLLAGCAERAVTNYQTYVSNDCGKNWNGIPAGDSIPRRIYACDLRVSIPNYPMQGDAKFNVGFKGNVRVGVSTSYEYNIIEGQKFLKYARYIGRQNSTADGSDNSASSYEAAENSLIDRRIRDIADNLLNDEDIVTFNSSKFEDQLLKAVNEALKDRGVQLQAMAFLPTPDEQTRLAIDAGAAIRVYQAAGIEELGKQMMIQRAGASNVTTNVKSAGLPVAEE